MGRRTSSARSLPGNALGGVMRATQRQARAATRRIARPVEEAEAAVPDATPAATRPGPFVAVVQSNSSGLAHFAFPATLDATPVVAAVAVSDLPVMVTVAWATCAAVALRVWDFDGNAVPAGTPVHVAVFPQ